MCTSAPTVSPSESASAAEPIRFVQASDMALDRTFAPTRVELTDSTVRVVCGENVQKTLEIGQIREAVVDELFGGARLVAKTARGDEILAYYSRALVPEFASFARALNDVVGGRAPLAQSEQQAATCRRCGAPLPERGASCGLCVPRGKIMRRLLGLLAPQRGKAIVLMVLSFATVGSQLIQPHITKVIIDEVITAKRMERLPLWVAALFGCALFYFLARLVSGRMISLLGTRLTADLRSQLHSHLQFARMSYHNKREPGTLVGRVMNDTGELQQFLTDGFPYLLVNVLSFVGIAAILLHKDLELALLVFLPAPLLLIGGHWYWRKIVPLWHRHGSRVGVVHTILDESLHGIKSVKAFAQEKNRVAEFDGAGQRMLDVRQRLDRTSLGFSEGTFFIMSLGVIAVWYRGAARVGAGGAFSLGDLIEFLAYIWMFYGPLQWSTILLNWMSHAFAAAERVFNLLDEPIERDAPNAVALPKIRGEIAFEQVRFSYDRGKEVLKGISFSAKPGEMIGLVGRSGGGKSTIISLVCRFYEIDSGRISVDGHALDQIRLEDLRRQIGIVMQEPFLFNASILENIRFGAPHASFADVVRAAKAAKAHEFILDKEDGYDTVIGEGGTKLSGGEKQRLSIARAILNDPPILILDEATSAVDSETEHALQEAIANLIKGRTTIAIAHRLATLRNASRLVVIDDGRVVEQGTHAELLAKDGGYFAKLVRLQTENNRLREEVLL